MMIGVDEFNVHNSQPANDSTGDIDEASYIEAFLAPDNHNRGERTAQLIDIVRPRPQSRRQGSTQMANTTSVSRTNGRRK